MELLPQYFVALTALLCLSLSFSSLASAQTATFNTPPYTPCACYGFENEGVMIAAASDEIWNNGAACGQMYKVSCLSGTNEGTPFPCFDGTSVVVKITDRCGVEVPCRGTLDLSQEASICHHHCRY